MKTNVLHSDILKRRYIPTSEFYAQIVNSLQDYCILTTDNNLIVNSWSSGAASIFGYDESEILGIRFDLLYTEEDRTEGVPMAEIQASIINGRAEGNRWHLRKNGTLFFAYGLVFPLIGADGSKLGFVKILRDLTEQKRSEEAIMKHLEELEELNAHKENILSIVSHDLRSPLARIIGLAECLKNDWDTLERDEALKMINFLYDASKEELAMLDYLVEWARIKYASDSFKPTSINLYLYVMKVVEMLNQLASANSIKIENKVPENIDVFADGKMVLSIVQNILSNAIKFSNKEGQITITSAVEKNEVVVSIADNGIGMSTETLQKLFTPQISRLSQKNNLKKGAGIGLLLTKSFLEKNGGRIWAESEIGKGTTFYFSLPLTQSHDSGPLEIIG